MLKPGFDPKVSDTKPHVLSHCSINDTEVSLFTFWCPCYPWFFKNLFKIKFHFISAFFLALEVFLLQVSESFLYLFLFKDFIYLFLERGEGRKKEKERNINVWLPLVCPQLGTWPTTHACALSGNGTGDPLVCRPALKPLSHTSQGFFISL